MDLESAAIIKDFCFFFNSLINRFLKGQFLSKKFSALQKNSWEESYDDRFRFPEGDWRIVFKLILSRSFSNGFGSKLQKELFFYFVRRDIYALTIAEIGWGDQRLRLLHFLRYCLWNYYKIYYLLWGLRWELCKLKEWL